MLSNDSVTREALRGSFARILYPTSGNRQCSCDCYIAGSGTLLLESFQTEGDCLRSSSPNSQDKGNYLASLGEATQCLFRGENAQKPGDSPRSCRKRALRCVFGSPTPDPPRPDMHPSPSHRGAQGAYIVAQGFGPFLSPLDDTAAHDDAIYLWCQCTHLLGSRYAEPNGYRCLGVATHHR